MTRHTFGMRRKHRNYRKKTLRNKKFRGGDGEECPICTDSLDDGRPTIETDCAPVRHKFHRECLRNSCNSGTVNRNRCPLCRQNIAAICNELNHVNQLPPPVVQLPPAVEDESDDDDYESEDDEETDETDDDYEWPEEPTLHIPHNQWRRAGFPIILNNFQWRTSEYNLWKTITNPDPRIMRYVRIIILLNSGLQNDDINRICDSFPNLVWLVVNHNNITHIPDTIQNLTNLTDLYIEHNQITHLPNSMGNLRKLQNLKCKHNHIPPQDIINIFASPYWNNKQVMIEANGLYGGNNQLPYGFSINSENYNNTTSTRPRTIPQTAGLAQGKSKKFRKTNKRKRSTKTRK
jgi:hypothetical protein